MAIALSKPSIKRKDMDAVLSCMVSDSIGPGSVTSRFAGELASYLGVAGGVALREYPRAIGLVLDALEIEGGRRIALSPLLPAAYYFTCLERDVYPVFLDVRRDVPLLDLSLESLPDVDAVVVDTTLGFVPDLERAEGLGIPVVEDVSQGLGGRIGERKAGSVGRYTICALEPDHVITAGGGAAILGRTNRYRTALRRLTGSLPAECILPDMNGALASTQMRELDHFIQRRREIAEQLQGAVQRSRHTTPAQAGDAEPVPYAMPVLVETALPEIVEYAGKQNIEARGAFSSSIIGSYDEIDLSVLPNARSFLQRCVRFPLYPTLSRSEIEMLARVLTTLP